MACFHHNHLAAVAKLIWDALTNTQLTANIAGAARAQPWYFFSCRWFAVRNTIRWQAVCKKQEHFTKNSKSQKVCSWTLPKVQSRQSYVNWLSITLNPTTARKHNKKYRSALGHERAQKILTALKIAWLKHKHSQKGVKSQSKLLQDSKTYIESHTHMQLQQQI